MTKPINVSNIINARLDAAGFVSINLTKRLKDYFSDIDEEIAALRKKPKPKDDLACCWNCNEVRMYPSPELSGSFLASWYECWGCGATKCLNPTKLHGLPKVRWEGRGGR